MQGLVTLDFGNTNPTAAIFHKHQAEWKLIKSCPINELNLFLKDLKMEPGNTSMVLSQVRERKEELNQLREQGYLITELKEYWRGERFAGMPVNYAHTLGQDRLIQAFYIYKKIKKNCLLLDAGTFLTLDVITQQGFRGGYIIPGLKNYLQAFTQGELLKDADLSGEIQSLLPTKTSEAMRDSYIAFYYLALKLIQDHQIDQVILTGGGCAFWKKIFEEQKLKIEILTKINFIHESLLYWMTTQIELL